MNNLQTLSAEMSRLHLTMSTRLQKLNRIAREQQDILLKNNPKVLKD